jgi:DNA-binding GntR family transcriptional regulator
VFANFKTKTQAVYEALRHDILNGKLKPGEKIVISNLAKAFGLSGIPVREAIKKLESEGLLQVTPHLGTTVSRFDGKEFVEIGIIRGEMEALATRLAAPYLSEVDISFLEKKIEEMESAMKEKHYRVLSSLNQDFHLRIYKAAPYPYLYKLIVDLWEKSNRAQSVFILSPERAVVSIREHKQILEALRRKDGVLAERLIRGQKKRSLKTIINMIEESDRRKKDRESKKKEDDL